MTRGHLVDERGSLQSRSVKLPVAPHLHERIQRKVDTNHHDDYRITGWAVEIGCSMPAP